MKNVFVIAGTILLSSVASNSASAQTNKLDPTGFAGVGTVTPLSLMHLKNDDGTVDYPGVNSRGDMLLFGEAKNNSFEIGVAGGLNSRKSWLLSRHSSIVGTYGKYYSTMHLQPDVGDKSVYKGIAIGFPVSEDLIQGTHLAVNGRTGIGILHPSHNLSVGLSNSYASNTAFSALFKTGVLVGNPTNSSTLYLYNGGPGSLHGMNAFNYETNQYENVFVGWGDSDVILAKDASSVGVGTTYIPDGYKMAVKGKIICEELDVRLYANWPDYVFQKNYTLRPLSEVENFIKTNNHLPNIPSAEEVKEEGLEVGEMLRLQMEKIEELTLYIIEQDKRIKELETQANASK